MTDCHLFTKPVFFDSRGYFIEQFNVTKDAFTVQQISESVSHPYTFRGFHFQQGMDKILRVVGGRAHIYLLDVFSDTPVLKKFSMTADVSMDWVQYLYIPSHYAIGFMTTERTHIQYFQNAVRTDKNHTINISSFQDQIEFAPSIQHISPADATAMSWDMWKSSRSHA
jgi:dTDP-4-dehydrorhamnose 3,5-epimerase-like enzyme